MKRLVYAHPMEKPVGIENHGFEAVECGVGAIHAARRAREVASACRDQDVVFIGSCGVFGPFEKPFLCRAVSVEWLPPCVRSNIAYSIAGVEPPVLLPPPNQQFLSLPAAKVLCTSTISLKNNLPGSDLVVENLELYSVVEPILETARSFICILGITNEVGPNAHEQWRTHRDYATSMIGCFLMH